MNSSEFQASFTKEEWEKFSKGVRMMTDEEHEMLEKFRKDGNQHLEKAWEGITWTDNFASGLQSLSNMFSHVDLSKPFRVVVDYDPEQPRAVIHTYLPKAHE